MGCFCCRSHTSGRWKYRGCIRLCQAGKRSLLTIKFLPAFFSKKNCFFFSFFFFFLFLFSFFFFSSVMSFNLLAFAVDGVWARSGHLGGRGCRPGRAGPAVWSAVLLLSVLRKMRSEREKVRFEQRPLPVRHFHRHVCAPLSHHDVSLQCGG